MPTEDAYSFGHLVLSHFGTCMYSMSRPISPELVLFPDFWISNIPLYFSFVLRTERPTDKVRGPIICSEVDEKYREMFEMTSVEIMYSSVLLSSEKIESQHYIWK